MVGDWGRDGKDHQLDVAQAMNAYALKYNAQFTISTGDNFYNDGIQTVNDAQWLTSFENIYTGKGLQHPWYITLGNHDHRGNPNAEIAYTQKSKRWVLPAHYYTKTFAIAGQDSVLMVFFDSSPLCKKYWTEPHTYTDLIKQDTAAQLKWIDSVFAHSHAKCKMLVGHHPIYSAGNGHGNTPELIASVKPILLKHKVQFSFAGHDHDLQHLKLAGEPVEYFVSGGGSAIRSSAANAQSLFYSGSSGFAFVSISSTAMQVFFIGFDGKVLYSTTVPLL